VNDNGVLRKIVGLKRDEVNGGWRKRHKELHDLYTSPSVIKSDEVQEDEMAEACSTNGEKGTHLDNW
jgi:hypothetical protein